VSAVRWVTADLPLVPDPDEARRWAEQELAKPEYTAAEPTPFDRIAQAIADFLAGLFRGGDGLAGWDGLLTITVIVLVTALVAAAFLIWGRPRALSRSQSSPVELFGADRRSAAELRREAGTHATDGDWNAAIVLAFRGLARGVAERGIVDPLPGATVHAFARDTARAFPAEQERLDAAAAAFDDVRYLRRPGTPELYDIVVGADTALQAARPQSLPDLAELTS
jgi:hypothetical protein